MRDESLRFLEELIKAPSPSGHDASVPLGQTVWVHGKRRIVGAVGRKAIHLLGPGESQDKLKMGDIWIDIGATSHAEAEEVVRLGDIVTFQRDFQPLLGDRAVARVFDNKAGRFVVAEAIRLLKEEGGLSADVGVYALGTAQRPG